MAFPVLERFAVNCVPPHRGHFRVPSSVWSAMSLSFCRSPSQARVAGARPGVRAGRRVLVRFAPSRLTSRRRNARVTSRAEHLVVFIAAPHVACPMPHRRHLVLRRWRCRTSLAIRRRVLTAVLAFLGDGQDRLAAPAAGLGFLSLAHQRLPYTSLTLNPTADWPSSDAPGPSGSRPVRPRASRRP